MAVCEGKNNRLQIFGAGGQPEVVIDKSLDRNLHKPSGVCSGMSGSMLLATDVSEICFYNTHGHSMDRRPVGNARCLKGITLLERQERFVVSNDGTKAAVTVCNLEGKVINKFRGNFVEPLYIATNPDTRTTAVCDVAQRQVEVYNLDGKLVSCLDPQYVSVPTGVAYNKDGNLLVADQGSQTVSEFDQWGSYMGDVITMEDGLRHPRDLAVLPYGRGKEKIAVASEFSEVGNRNYYKLQVFTPRERT